MEVYNRRGLGFAWRDEIGQNSQEEIGSRGRKMISRTEFAINLANSTADLRFQLLVLLDILSTRHSNLDENHLSNPIRIVAEKLLESVELLDKALDVIEPVNAEDDLDVLISLPQFVYPRLDFWLAECFVELLWIDSNHESVSLD